MRRFVVVVAMSLGTGCALEPGHGFGTITGASLSARLTPGPARDLGGGAILTNLGHRVTLRSAHLTLGPVQLQSLGASGGGSGAVFDPASPPPGYSLCHSGHCHSDSGELVSYEEIQAELAGGGAAGYRAEATFGAVGEVDLLAAGPRALGEPAPSRELPETTLVRAVVQVERVALEGEVELAEPSAGEPRAELVVSLPFDGALTAAISRPVDRDHPAELDVEVAITLDGTVFDDLPFDRLSERGRVALETTTASAAETLITHVAAAALSASL